MAPLVVARAGVSSRLMNAETVAKPHSRPRTRRARFPPPRRRGASPTIATMPGLRVPRGRHQRGSRAPPHGITRNGASACVIGLAIRERFRECGGIDGAFLLSAERERVAPRNRQSLAIAPASLESLPPPSPSRSALRDIPRLSLSLC